MKVMILAAGRGVRMRPLSYATPKPLLKVGSIRIIEHLFQNLKKAGIKEVVINISYLAEKIIDALGDGSKYDLEIIYSIEENGPYGTGGGIYKALPFLGNNAFLVVSGDIWTDFPFDEMIKKFNNSSSEVDAHLILIDRKEFHQGDFGLQQNGFLCMGLPKYTYASMGIIHPRLFNNVNEEQFPLAPLLVSAIEKGRATGELYNGTWFNIGTPTQLQQLKLNDSVENINK